MPKKSTRAPRGRKVDASLKRRVLKGRKTRRFSDKSPYAGFASIVMTDYRAAARVVNFFAKDINFWQVNKQWAVKIPPDRAARITGFSKPWQRKDSNRGRFTAVHVKRAVDDSGYNAGQRYQGLAGSDGPLPEFVRPLAPKKRFVLMLWFKQGARQTFLNLVGRK